jgi:hypothetical protein
MRVNDSLKDYIDHIEKICSSGRFLFRGQLRKDKLLPKVFREDIDIDPKTLDTEKGMLNEFERRGRPLLEIEPQSKYEWLALAQHHGIPTRLLDWTSSALAALWFTVSDDRRDMGGVDNDGAVWALKFTKKDVKRPSKNENPFKREKTKVFRPTHIEKRFVAQGGWFTIHSNLRPLNEQKGLKMKLTKIIIPRILFGKIRFLLNICGMNQVTLFPDFGGLCKHIAWQNSKDYVKRRNGKT